MAPLLAVASAPTATASSQPGPFTTTTTRTTTTGGTRCCVFVPESMMMMMPKVRGVLGRHSRRNADWVSLQRETVSGLRWSFRQQQQQQHACHGTSTSRYLAVSDTRMASYATSSPTCRKSASKSGKQVELSLGLGEDSTQRCQGEQPSSCLRTLGLGVGAAILVAFADTAAATAASETVESLELLATEPSNALSLPTWTIHIASVFEWITAMALVWQYGETPGNSAWKGLAWGMVPLLGGAMAACTWHVFYNDPALEVLVALQGALTFIGNCTLWIAAYRIYQISQGEKA